MQYRRKIGIREGTGIAPGCVLDFGECINTGIHFPNHGLNAGDISKGLT
ncbi:hypothetical protein JCM19238_4411 [Vibrio ponticus]|nr:hypothetical protein JCM19238_4411 [Vibrio ponticus]